MRESVVLLIALVFVALGLLVWLASTGSVAAAYTLGLLTGVILYAVYSLFELARGKAQAQREQAGFMANAKENLAIMQSMQSLQNKQNQTLMSQITRMPPETPVDNGTFLLDDGIFDELD